MASAATGAGLGPIRALFGGGNVAGLTDGQLLERFDGARDEAAFAALVARHGPMVLAVCRQVLGDDHDAEDAFQATFLTLARKAGSLRPDRPVGGWLYRVASRVALRARAVARRRRGVERDAGTRAAAKDDGPDPWADWLPVLHDEIARLPGRHRDPIVLCDLHGLTYEQAARALGWTLPTLRGRLAGARRRLRARLSRRGVEGTGAFLALSHRRPMWRAVPDPWASAAVEAATRGASAGASAATATALAGRAWAWAWRASAASAPKAVAFAALLFAAALWGATGLRGPRPGPARPPGRAAGPAGIDPRTIAAAPPGPPSEQQAGPAEGPDGPIEYRGRVLGPRGEPFSGAALGLIGRRGRDPATPRPVRARSGPDGRFRFAVPRAEFEGPPADEPWRHSPIVASAEGFGPGWASPADLAPGAEMTLRLVADDVPVVGRVLDLQGRPVVGSSIRVDRIEEPSGGDLTPFLDARRRGDWNAQVALLDKILFEPSGSRLPSTLTTDADGRFRLAGVGRERVVRLRIEGPEIEQAIIDVVTRAGLTRAALDAVGPEAPMIDGKPIRNGPPLYGPAFEFLAGPGRVIGGEVREQATGKPLAGAIVRGSGEGEGHSQEVEATSDARGRYQLRGLPVAAKVQVQAYHEGHLPALKYADEGGGAAPASVDFELGRGVIVRGRVTEKSTGKPVHGIIVYQPLAGNAFYRDNPSGAWFEHVINGDSIRKDGTYEVLVGPGPGAILVQAQDRPRRTDGPSPRYLPARRPPGEAGAGAGNEDFLDGLGLDIFLPLYQAYGPVDPRPGGDPVTRDLQVVLAGTRPGRVVDPDGRPLAGATVVGLLGRFDRSRDLPGPDITAAGVDPSRPRYLIARHDGRRLAGTCVVATDSVQPFLLKLEPWGTVVGRLLDTDGGPLEGVRVGLGYQPREGATMVSVPDQLVRGRLTTDRDGRFRVEGLVPGLPATLHFTRGGRSVPAIHEIEDLTVRSGEVRDLGEIATRPAAGP